MADKPNIPGLIREDEIPAQDDSLGIPGLRALTPGEQEEIDYDSPITAGVAGAARSASFGLTDVAGKALGYDDELRKLQKYNPTASTVGEVTGVVGSLALGGPAAMLAKASERAAAKLILGEGAKQVIARGALAAGAEGAAQGAGLSISDIALAQKEYTPNQVAESLIANVGMGFLLGGAVGGITAAPRAFRGSRKFISKVDDVAARSADNLVDDMARTIDDAVVGGSDDIERFGGRSILDEAVPTQHDAAQVFEELGFDADKAKKLIRTEADYFSKNIGDDTIAGAIVNKDKEAFRNTIIKKVDAQLKVNEKLTADQIGADAKARLYEQFNKNRESFNALYESRNLDYQKINLASGDKGKALTGLNRIKIIGSSPGKTKLNEAVKLLKSGELKTASDIAAYKSQILSEARASLDTEVRHQLNSVADVLGRLEDRSVISAVSKATGGDKAAQGEVLRQARALKTAYRAFAEDTREVASLLGKSKLRNLKDLTEVLDKIPNEQIGTKIINRNLRNVEGLLRTQERLPKVFEQSRQRYVLDMYESSIKNGKLDLVDFIKKANKLQPDAMDVLFTPEGARTLRNINKVNKFNPNLLRTSEQVGNTAHGLITNMKNEIKDAAFFAISKAIGYVDNAAGASAKETQLGTKGLIANPKVGGAVRKVETKIQKSIKTFLEGTKKAAGFAPPVTVQGVLGSRAENEKRMDKFVEYAANPQSFVDQIAKNTRGVEQYSPEVAQSMMNSAMEAVSFLTDKMPKRDVGFSQEVFGEPNDYSDYEVSTFNRYARAVENPLTILEDIETGTLTPQAVEAVSVIYPGLLNEIKTRAMDELAKKKPKLDYSKKIQLSMLLGVPLSDTMKPEFIAAMQKATSNQGPEQMGSTQSSRKNAGLSNIAENYQTQSQRISNIS